MFPLPLRTLQSSHLWTIVSNSFLGLTSTKWADHIASSLDGSQSSRRLLIVSYSHRPHGVLFHQLTALQLRNRRFRERKEISIELYRSSHRNHSYEAFIEGCPPSQLNKDRFRRMEFWDSPLFDVPSELLNYLFNAIDEDRDGFINFREFICAASVIRRGTLEERFKRTSRSTRGTHPINLFCS